MLRQQLGTQVERLKANNRSMETADTKIRETIAHLGPFHQDIQLSEKLSTGQVFSATGELTQEENGNVRLMRLLNDFTTQIGQIYPEWLGASGFSIALATPVVIVSGRGNWVLNWRTVLAFANTGSSKRGLCAV